MEKENPKTVNCAGDVLTREEIDSFKEFLRNDENDNSVDTPINKRPAVKRSKKWLENSMKVPTWDEISGSEDMEETVLDMITQINSRVFDFSRTNNLSSKMMRYTDDCSDRANRMKEYAEERNRLSFLMGYYYAQVGRLKEVVNQLSERQAFFDRMSVITSDTGVRDIVEAISKKSRMNYDEIAEVAGKSGVNRETLDKILHDLEAIGYIEHIRIGNHVCFELASIGKEYAFAAQKTGLALPEAEE